MSELERVETGLGEPKDYLPVSEKNIDEMYSVPMIWMVAMLRRQCTMVCLPFSTEGRKAAELQ